MIAVIDYGVGNLFSLRSSLRHLGLEAAVTADPEVIRAADRVILPGVGAFGDAMEQLERRGLVPVVRPKPPASPCWASAWGCSCCLRRAMSMAAMPGWGWCRDGCAPWPPTWLTPPSRCPRSAGTPWSCCAPRTRCSLSAAGGVRLLCPQLLRQRLCRQHPGGQRILHPGDGRGAGGLGVRRPVPPRKERRHRPAHPAGLCGIH